MIDTIRTKDQESTLKFCLFKTWTRSRFLGPLNVFSKAAFRVVWCYRISRILYSILLFSSKDPTSRAATGSTSALMSTTVKSTSPAEQGKSMNIGSHCF